MITQKVRTRLDALRRELAIGQRKLAEIERQRTELEQTLLRISGAIQVLEEMRDEPDEETERDRH